MRYRVDQPFTTSVGESYAIKNDHRNGSRSKSQWITTLEEEVAAFEDAYGSNWISRSGKHAWGLHFVDGKPHILGIASANSSRRERLRLAKFVRNMAPSFWHGYPANYRRKPQDRPPVVVLLKAFVVKNQDNNVTEEEILSFCKERLAPYKTPKSIEFCDELPKSTVGKLLRRVLADEEREKMLTGAAKPPSPS